MIELTLERIETAIENLSRVPVEGSLDETLPTPESSIREYKPLYDK